MKMLTDEINGPHFLFEDDNPATEAVLKVRPRYCATGKIALIVTTKRRCTEFTVDAADLIKAVSTLVPAATR